MGSIIRFVPAVLIVFLISCARTPDMLVVNELQPLELKRSEPYTIDLDGYPKPDKPKIEYARYLSERQLAIVNDAETAQLFVMKPEEFAKINQLLTLTLSYKHIIGQQERLINQKVDTENALKELAELERLKSIEYQKLWVNSENMYRMERYSLEKQLSESRIVQIVFQLGLVGVLALVL